MARSHSLCRSLSWKEPSVKSSSSHQNPSKHGVLPSFSPSGHYLFALILAFSQYLKSLDRYELLYFSSSSLLPLQHLHYCISLHQSEFKTCLFHYLVVSWSFCSSVLLFCAVCPTVRWLVFRFSGLVSTFFCIEYSDAKST